MADAALAEPAEFPDRLAGLVPKAHSEIDGLEFEGDALGSAWSFLLEFLDAENPAIAEATRANFFGGRFDGKGFFAWPIDRYWRPGTDCRSSHAAWE